MQTILATEMLKTGEELTVACVEPPDALRESQIRPFLAHKPSHYREHVDLALAGQCGELETRFYIGLIGGDVVGNIMTAESQGVGIFGHVHTREDQRRKGICNAIMTYQMEDFRRRGGRVLLLGTGYQSPAYRIYESHGFRDWPEGHPGLMRYDSEPFGQFESRFVAGSRGTPAPAAWKHWPLAALLAALPSAVTLRSLTLGLWGVGLLEGSYCKLMTRIRGSQDVSAGVLEAKTGAVLALATCVPDERWPGIWLLDLFSNTNLDAESLTALLCSLDLPSKTIQCYADVQDALKISALERLGFQRTATLPAQYRVNESWHEVELYTRPDDHRPTTA